MELEMICTRMASMDCTCGRVCFSATGFWEERVCVCCTEEHVCVLCARPAGRIPRSVASVKQHMLTSDDVVSCCMDLNAPSISFRINGQPVQGMFENFNTDGLFFPVVSFSAGVKYENSSHR